MYELVIRGGTVITPAEPVTAEIGVDPETISLTGHNRLRVGRFLKRRY